MIRKMKKAKYYSLIFFVILLFFVSSTISQVKAESEPNDSYAQADDLESGQMIGVVTKTFSVYDYDYWKIKCASNSDITVSLDYIVAAGDLYIALYDSNYDLIYDEEVTPPIPGVWERNYYASIGGWYYFKIYCEGSSPSASVGYEMPVDYTPFEELEWIAPDSGYIEFGVDPNNDSAIFDFIFDQKSLQKVELWLNDTFYHNYDTLLPTNIISETIEYNETIDGFVVAELKGIRDGEVIISTERNFTFAKLTYAEYEILNQGVEFLGNKLYSILYDPNGDNSFSGWEEGSTFSMGVGASLSISVGVSIGVEFDALLCSGEANLEIKTTEETGYDFRYETTELTEITSAQSDNDPDAIGPGYGDYFWGEVWAIPWKLGSVHKEYWNGTPSYINNNLTYGINRSATALIIASQAPQGWLDISLYPNYPSQNVTWIGTKEVSGGGGEETYTEQIISTEAFHHSVTIDIGTEASGKIGSYTTTLTLDVQTKVYKEVSAAYSILRYYHLKDDDVGDNIENRYGYDRRFGTFVFQTLGACLTSNPLEHNTVDYHHPIIYTPSIDYDSSDDGIFPCEDDEPIVVVEIEDEGGIQSAWINYTLNEGLSWNKVDLTEQVANPGFWEGQIPTQEHGTEVHWFIEAKDNFNQKSEKKNEQGNPYSYTIINRAPVIEVVTPNGGEVYTGDEILINWTSSDPDDDDLTYSIAYNINNQGWQSLILELTDDSYNWDITNYDVVDSILIRVTAYDNFGGVASDTSDFIFSISRRPTEVSGFYLPSLVILSVLALAILGRIVRKRR
jgi:hypothetical protein